MGTDDAEGCGGPTYNVQSWKRCKARGAEQGLVSWAGLETSKLLFLNFSRKEFPLTTYLVEPLPPLHLVLDGEKQKIASTDQ